jgi:hypothetical protein
MKLLKCGVICYYWAYRLDCIMARCSEMEDEMIYSEMNEQTLSKCNLPLTFTSYIIVAPKNWDLGHFRTEFLGIYLTTPVPRLTAKRPSCTMGSLTTEYEYNHRDVLKVWNRLEYQRSFLTEMFYENLPPDLLKF